MRWDGETVSTDRICIQPYAPPLGGKTTSFSIPSPLFHLVEAAFRCRAHSVTQIDSIIKHSATAAREKLRY